jgi:hypothetical protein
MRNLRLTTASTRYDELSKKQKKQYNFNKAVYGDVFLELVEPTLLRRIKCFIIGLNPNYRVIDNRTVRFGGKGYYV